MTIQEELQNTRSAYTQTRNELHYARNRVIELEKVESERDSLKKRLEATLAHFDNAFHCQMISMLIGVEDRQKLKLENRKLTGQLEQFRIWLAEDIQFPIDDSDPTAVLAIAFGRIHSLENKLGLHYPRTKTDLYTSLD